jgi:hypothetical protein
MPDFIQQGQSKTIKLTAEEGGWLKGQKRKRQEIAIRDSESIEKDRCWTQQTKYRQENLKQTDV